jgi:hypothetical protein
MKRVLFAVICLSMMLSAGTNSANQFQIYKAAFAPTIDGEMDDIWKTASYERLGHMNADDAAPPDNYLDCFVEARCMWDDDNFYVFAKIVDEEISSTSANSWENDSFEYFFDGDNSKSEAVDGVDDIQIRIEYQDGSDITKYDASHGPALPPGTVGAVADWENPSGDAMGWAVEALFPLAELNIEASTVIGFELQLNERDADTRQNMYRWWGLNNDSWNSPDLWGEAELVDYQANDVLNVPSTATAPTIDGVLDDPWAESSYAIEAGTYVFTNADIVGTDYAEIEEWEDLQMNFRTMWDASNLYVWIEVIDDEVSISSANSWENDSIEICVDGDNSKGDAWDTNDSQTRWVWSAAAGSLTGDVVAWGELAELEGYAMELKIPAADLKFPLENEQEIGLEIQVNDRDAEVRQNMIRWWLGDNMSWQQPVRWGTAVLTGGSAVAREIGPNAFGLNQNFPNPFNPTTNISFTLDKRSAVKLTVFDVLGNEVAQLVNDVRQAGPQIVSFDGSKLSSGVYFYKLETASNVITKKMMLMK